jgi:hypothetical protein
MIFELEPLQGVGPLRLGMPINEAVTVLHTLGTPYHSCLIPGPLVSRPDGTTLRLTAYDYDDELDGIHIEARCEPGSPNQVRYRGIDLLALPAQRVLVELRRSMTLTESYPGAYEAADLGFYIKGSDDLSDPFAAVTVDRPDPE